MGAGEDVIDPSSKIIRYQPAKEQFEVVTSGIGTSIIGARVHGSAEAAKKRPPDSGAHFEPTPSPSRLI
jgi:hypothetical protein